MAFLYSRVSKKQGLEGLESTGAKGTCLVCSPLQQDFPSPNMVLKAPLEVVPKPRVSLGITGCNPKTNKMIYTHKEKDKTI